MIANSLRQTERPLGLNRSGLLLFETNLFVPAAVLAKVLAVFVKIATILVDITLIFVAVGSVGP